MKKAIVLIQLILMLTIGIFGCFSVVYANMAAPQPNRLGTGIVFEKYDNISVISENLDISIKEDGNAEIMAEYKMKNLTNEKLSVRTMFIAPYSKKYSSYIVSVNNKEIETIESVYTIEDTTKITSENVWQDVIENGKKIQEDGSGEYDYYCKNNVVTIEYILEFEGNETIDVGVYYSQPLAGRPVVSSFYNYEAYGEIEYFLTPAKYWNGFEDLTITISMQGPLKKIQESTIAFEKIDDNKYQFISNELPNNELKIRFCEYSFDIITRKVTSYVFWEWFAPFLAILLLFLTILITIIAVRVELKNDSNKNQNITTKE